MNFIFLFNNKISFTGLLNDNYNRDILGFTDNLKLTQIDTSVDDNRKTEFIKKWLIL